MGNSKPNYRPHILLNTDQMKERKSKKLWFNYDEKYSYGHVWKRKR